MLRITRNLFEAAYYMTQGGKFREVELQKTDNKKLAKLGLHTVWLTTIDEVPETAVQLWHEGNPIVNARELEAARNKIKVWVHHNYADPTRDTRPQIYYQRKAKEAPRPQETV